MWRAKALERYPACTLGRLEPYASWRELLRDDNCEHAALLLRYEGLASRYNFAR